MLISWSCQRYLLSKLYFCDVRGQLTSLDVSCSPWSPGGSIQSQHPPHATSGSLIPTLFSPSAFHLISDIAFHQALVTAHNISWISRVRSFQGIFIRIHCLEAYFPLWHFLGITARSFIRATPTALTPKKHATGHFATRPRHALRREYHQHGTRARHIMLFPLGACCVAHVMLTAAGDAVWRLAELLKRGKQGSSSAAAALACLIRRLGCCRGRGRHLSKSK